jgi:hypothetical protein
MSTAYFNALPIFPTKRWPNGDVPVRLGEGPFDPGLKIENENEHDWWG